MLLIKTPPGFVEVAGVKHEINTDFRVWVEFELLIQDKSGDLATIFPAIFVRGIPADLRGAVEAIERFYCCGETPEKKATGTGSGKQPYAFDVDGNAIIADFWKHYNIDLTQEGLHWWVFRALLEGLPEESDFKHRVYYRTCDLKGLSKKERDRILKIRSRIEIKNKDGGKITLEERNANMIAYLARRRKETAGGEVNG